MKKQLIFFIIFAFIFGLTLTSVNGAVVAIADECSDITISSIRNSGSFRPTENQTIEGSGFVEGLTVKFNNGNLNGTVNFIDTTRIYATPNFSYSEPLRAGNLILTNSCGKTAAYAYATYGVPQIYSISPTVIYPGATIKIIGRSLSVSTYAKDLCQVYINGRPVSLNKANLNEGDMIFYLPVDTPIGSNYIEVSNENRMQSDKFYFEVSKHDCVASDWQCGSWSTCSVDGSQTKECNLISDCENSNAVKPDTSQGCIPECREDKWKCGEWSSCSTGGQQTRICIKDYDCPLTNTQSPATTQSCTYAPMCSADVWSCDDWGSCSASGIQNRSCTKTFDCSSVQTASPITDQYCEAPSKPQQAPPSESDEISNQNTIIKSTVKLLCPVDDYKASQGSGTIIDSSGTILTNKHVIAGTIGCWVGFINSFNDEPYFGDRHIADITKISSTQDVAILKMRNPNNVRLAYVDTTKGTVNFSLGTKITTYGYPAKFGTKITYTSGDFSGTEGNYLKTTAILEYGNSGGGAYLKNGTFVGIPSAVVKGELNAMGYLLSIDIIKAWLGNSSVASGSTSNNNYSRVSILEDMDLKKLDSLKLFIPDVDDKGNLSVSAANKNSQKTTEQPQPSQTQKESATPEQSSPVPSEQGKENKEEKGDNSDVTVSVQRRSIVANAAQEIIKVAERNGGIGQEIKVIAQTQIQNQEKLEVGMQKIQNRGGFAKFFIGPNYGEIKNSQKLLGQNKEQIQKLNEARTQIVNQGDQLQIIEQIQALEQVSQQMEVSLNESQKGFSLFGWVFRLFSR